MFLKLKSLNPDFDLFQVEDKEMRPYGKVISYDVSDFTAYAKQHAPVPAEGTLYERSVDAMEKMPLKNNVSRDIYGNMPIQVGWCLGHNQLLNALEYHKGSEIVVAATDMILLLGKLSDIQNGKYASQLVEGFYVTAGTAVELYSTTLHFAPVSIDKDGFIAVIVLPEMTNEPLTSDKNVCSETELLWMINKWLIAHPDSPSAKNGAHIGITGKNLEVVF